MRIYTSGYELMSEMGRDLWEMGIPVRPNSYQNKVVVGMGEFETRELMAKQYCLLTLDDPESLMAYSKSMDWVEAEFKERVALSDATNPGEAYKLRQKVWEQFLNLEGKFDYTYGERFATMISEGNSDYDVPTLNRIIHELRVNPGTRQAILPIFHHTDLDGMGGRMRIPCSMYYMLMLRPNVDGELELHLSYHQRSSDFVTHFGNDVLLAWKMKDYIAEKVGVKSGRLYHIIDSLHAYQKDWSIMKDTLSKHL